MSVIVIGFYLLSIGTFLSKVYGSPIYKGEPVIYDGEIYSFPFMALICYSGQPFCGSTIIGPKIILTAAHCLEDLNGSNLTIKAGSYIKDDMNSENVQIKNVEKIIMHEKYTKTNPNKYDIGLLFLESELNLTEFVNTIDIATMKQKESNMEKQVIFLGFGRTENGEKTNTLRKSTLVLIKNDLCQRLMPFNVKIKDTVICAIDPRLKKGSGCKGDSGGPLVSKSLVNGKHILLGITSLGVPNPDNRNICIPEHPTIFTDVVKLIPWIQKKTGIPKQEGSFCRFFRYKL